MSSRHSVLRDVFTTRDLGRRASGAAVGTIKRAPDGLSWLSDVDSHTWPADSRATAGALGMDPVTLKRLTDFLEGHSHTGLGRARPALTRDTFGLNEAARRSAYVQSADHVIGPRHVLYSEDV